jgi:D-alanyl-lipoteichoic acid acyltransferase DltB (MBOAT superfamily)
MLFNSIVFFVFLIIVFFIYWLFRNQLKVQNIVILVASYFFYGWWDWRFLSLIFISSILDYSIGISLNQIAKTSYRKFLLLLSVLVNIGILGFFKYFNFFIDSFSSFVQFFGFSPNIPSLQIILPVGISFYTFQTLSYTIDIYRRNIEPTKDIIAFFAFVSFFPQLVAGPIERARNLIPQFLRKREFNFSLANDGMRQMLWGFFKKLVIADNCSVYVNEIFGNYHSHTGGTLLLGAVLFGFQIYGDFSGYSDIAIGTGRLFGFNLMQNFAFPYFSRDIAEFWRRWHISLSTWFRDYIYIPLGGSRGNREMQFRNVLIIFLVSGFWHGANFTFIAWGGVHALMFIPLLLVKKNRQHTDCIENREILKNPLIIGKVILTFLLVTVAWVFFRMPTLGGALHYIETMATSLFSKPTKQFFVHQQAFFYGIIIMLIFEWINRTRKHGLQIVNWPTIVRWFIYLSLAFFIFMFGNFNQVEFIYFAF